MYINNDRKIKNIKRISLRNLYLEQKSTSLKSSEVNATPKRIQPKDEKSPRRKSSLLQRFGSLEEQSSATEILNVNLKTLVDSFITIHTGISPEDEKLLYISEIQRSNMNPDFTSISIPDTSQGKSSKLTIRLWCRAMPLRNKTSSFNDQWRLLYNYDMNLKALKYIGGSIKNMEDYFHNNSIILKINDNYYTDSRYLRISGSLIRSTSINNRSVLPSYSLNSIRAINNLMKCLAEVRVSKSKISKDINNYNKSHSVETNADYISARKQQLQHEIKLLDKNIAKQKQENDNVVSKIISTKVKIEEMKELVDNKIPSIVDVCSNNIDVIDSQIESLRENLEESIYPDLKQQLREKICVLQEMVPIENADNSLSFIIMGNKFPSTMKELTEVCYYNETHSFFNDFGEEVLNKNDHDQKIEYMNACISFIAQLLVAVAAITNMKLENAMYLQGNRCLIFDPLDSESQVPSNSESLKEEDLSVLYPLYYNASETEKVVLDIGSSNKHVVLKNRKFEHALLLLNKNLVNLINNITDAYNSYNALSSSLQKVSSGIPIDSTDNLLWNFKYLLLFITAP